MPRSWRIHAAVLVALAVCAGCTTWSAVSSHPRWTLYAEDPDRVDAKAFCRAYEPAFAVIEGALGRFDAPVRVHAWEAADGSVNGVGAAHDVPGIGRARVRAFHSRSSGPFGPRHGIYASSADAGTAVHELVHARVAEIDPKLPLWFEEGLASVMGDGFMDDERWVIDGLACWPLRELRDKPIDDRELARLLKARAEDGADLRENVLVHFVGWAIVFDLYRESGRIDWEGWRGRARSMTPAEARVRLDRTIARATEQEWLRRLSHADRGVRLATAKGLWKLRSELVLAALLERLGDEEDPEVRVALAINALAAAGEREPPGRLVGRMWRTVWPVLRRAELADPSEQRAIELLMRSFRWRGDANSTQALEGLRRFWAE